MAQPALLRKFYNVGNGYPFTPVAAAFKDIISDLECVCLDLCVCVYSLSVSCCEEYSL